MSSGSLSKAVQDKADDILKSTISQLSRTLFLLEQRVSCKGASINGIGEGARESKSDNSISSCNHPHDSIPKSTDRGSVGVIQEINTKKTVEQRNRATKKSIKKHEKSKKLKSLIPPFWCGGIPRSIKTLSIVTASEMFTIGDVYEERDQGELALREYHEYMDRQLKMRKYPEKIRS